MSDARADMIPQVMARLLAARQLAHQERKPGAAVAATKALAEFLTAKLMAADIPPEPVNVVIRRFITLEDGLGNFRRDEAGNLVMREYQRPGESAAPVDVPKADDVSDELAGKVLEQLEVHGLVPGDDADAMECILSLLRKHEAEDAHA